MDDIKEIQFNNGLIPAIVQEECTGEVLMLAYMNEESFKKTMETETTWFWSRSRKSYGIKEKPQDIFNMLKK